MSKNPSAKAFAIRSVFCFYIILMLLMSSILRVAVISSENYSQIQSNQTSYRINVSTLRGTIYDCNMVPLTNNSSKIMAAVTPNPRSIIAISQVLEDNALETVLDNLKNNKPVVCKISKNINCDGIATTTVYERYNNENIACHLIGYTNSDGHGISGLELAYDDILYSESQVSAVFSIGGNGEVLKGISPFFENDLSQILNGVVTTVDINIQGIAEKYAALMNSGCVIVSEVQTGKIRAMASVPTFDVSSISESLVGKNSPMINRALYTFNVGSIFKPCIAATAIEKNISNVIFNCEGRLEIGDRNFRCHNLSGHGQMNLCSSLAQSCNCYFYNIANLLGGEYVYDTAAKLSINSTIKLADNYYALSGILPNKNELSNSATLANLSIGQGNLMSSPIAMLNLYTAIAGNGSYYIPSVVEKTIKDGEENYYNTGSPTCVMKPETAKILREYLKTVISEGTGKEAQPTFTTAAGKTATAQTGRYYEDKTEITNSWFCGFFPADEPQYVVVIMSDNKIDVSTASIFAKIADGITEYKGINVEKND